MLSRLAILVPLMLLCACAGNSRTPDRERAIPSSSQQLSREVPAFPETGPIAEELSTQIATTAVPDGIDDELWQQLCAALQDAVADRPAPPASPGPALFALDSRSASFTPYGTQNMVRDLRLSGSGPWRLSWTYRNSGDYDLNGSVTISDLTPVGKHFGRRQSDPLWFAAMHADGDGNGEVNISDVTVIGQNFGGSITGYAVYGTDDMSGEWTHLGNATVATNLHKNSDRLRFVIRLDSLEFNSYALWPYDNSDDEGGWSNPAAQGTAPDRSIRGIRSVLGE
ncbi:MAG: hypothetical protein H7A35_02605 [Planctomycetales bacterium]|nr:hypothetical protein [bacterium]UNM08950.1 MAG: hypothetical protein H7A35_02605 [Planctomycetales bacterium]